MSKKKAKKHHPSFLATFFHKPLLFIFLFLTLPIVLWGIGQNQQIASFGKNINKNIFSKLKPQQSSCPTASNQTYTHQPLNPNKPNKMKFDPAKNPETNIMLRGWYEINEGKELVSRHGDNYGLDPNMPPQISTLFTSHYPKIIKTYRVNAWDYENNRNIPGESATPNFKVHMLGLEATPGEPLVGLKAGNFLVRYATPNYILMTNGDEDEWDEDDDGGYPFYFLDICVDPNLLAAYQADAAGGRTQLPRISEGKIFGYAMTNEVKFVIRDTFSFMDERYKEDWWEYGGFKPEFGPAQPTVPIQPPVSTPLPTALPPLTPSTTPLPIIPTSALQQPQPTTIIPTSIPITAVTSVKPFYPTPTNIPTPTATPTPKPFINIKATVEGAKSIWTKLIIQMMQFTKVILP